MLLLKDTFNEDTASFSPYDLLKDSPQNSMFSCVGFPLEEIQIFAFPCNLKNVHQKVYTSY